MTNTNSSARAKAQGTSVKTDPVTGKKHNAFKETSKSYATSPMLTEYAQALNDPEQALVTEGSVVEWYDPNADGDRQYGFIKRVDRYDLTQDTRFDAMALVLADGTEAEGYRDEMMPIDDGLGFGQLQHDPFILGVSSAQPSTLDAATYEITMTSTAAIRKEADGTYAVEIVTTVDQDGGLVFENLEFASHHDVADHLRALAIPDENERSIFCRAAMLSAGERVQLSELHRDLNEGAWADINDYAKKTIWDADLAVDRVYEYAAPKEDTLTVLHRRRPSITDFSAAKACSDATWALVHRHLIDDIKGAWTQEAYDHMTRPFRTIVGSVHPDDEPTPESWSKRPGKDVPAVLFTVTTQKEPWMGVSRTTATRVRHVNTPTPSGCRWCGEPERAHGMSFARSVKFHYWTSPTASQRLSRMRARRAEVN